MDEGVSVIKTSLKSVGWREDRLQDLRDLVRRVHNITTHTYQLARWIFVNEPVDDPTFNPGTLLKTNFFKTVFLSLVQPQRRSGIKPKKQTKQNKDLVNKHVGAYMAAANIGRPNYGAMSEIAGYVNTEIEKAYTENVHLRFGETLRHTINVLLDTKKRAKEMDKKMSEKGKSKAEIRKACSESIWRPAKKVKNALRSRYIDPNQLSPKARWVYEQLKPVWATYDDPIKGNKGKKGLRKRLLNSDHEKGSNRSNVDRMVDDAFAKDNIYYDAKANPQRHLKAFYLL
ncbi:hypothetical protein H4R20_006817, partial [Coemansia guatemalensis]